MHNSNIYTFFMLIALPPVVEIAAAAPAVVAAATVVIALTIIGEQVTRVAVTRGTKVEDTRPTSSFLFVICEFSDSLSISALEASE